MWSHNVGLGSHQYVTQLKNRAVDVGIGSETAAAAAGVIKHLRGR